MSKRRSILSVILFVAALFTVEPSASLQNIGEHWPAETATVDR